MCAPGPLNLNKLLELSPAYDTICAIPKKGTNRPAREQTEEVKKSKERIRRFYNGENTGNLK